MNFGSPKVCRGLVAENPPPPDNSKKMALQTFITERKTRGNAALPLPSLQGIGLCLTPGVVSQERQNNSMT